MKIRTSVLTAIGLAAWIVTAAAAPAPLAVEKALAATAGTEADFVQKFTPKGFTRERIEQGKVVFGPAPKMRWEYRKPEQKLFVFDGTTSWLYTPSERQVMVAKLTAEDRKALPFVLLSDGAAVRTEYDVKEAREGDRIRTTLRPRAAAALLRDLVVLTGARDGKLRSISYVDRDGNRTTFEFTNFRSSKVVEATFRFSPPSGVEVVGD